LSTQSHLKFVQNYCSAVFIVTDDYKNIIRIRCYGDICYVGWLTLTELVQVARKVQTVGLHRDRWCRQPCPEFV